MLPFNYHHLYYFYAIAEEGSVTKAAKKLRLSQSSLSMQLGQFENFLEKKLFEREGKKLYLTEDGRHILSYAKSIFDLGEELSDSLGDRARKGKLRIQIGVSSYVPKSIVDTVLQYLFDHNQPTYINVIEKNMGQMIKDLALHKLDMILNDFPYQASAEQGIENHLLGKIPVLLCANKQLAKKVKQIPKDLNKVPIILPTSQSNTYHAIQEYFLSHKIKPNTLAEIQDLELVRRLVLAGKGIAPINEISILKAPTKEKLVIIGKKTQLNIHDSVYLIKKERKIPHPLVMDLLENFRI